MIGDIEIPIRDLLAAGSARFRSGRLHRQRQIMDRVTDCLTHDFFKCFCICDSPGRRRFGSQSIHNSGCTGMRTVLQQLISTSMLSPVQVQPYSEADGVLILLQSEHPACGVP